MSVFNKYSRYYDVLYRDKSYDDEVDFVDGLVQKYCSGAKTMLEMGAGPVGTPPICLNAVMISMASISARRCCRSHEKSTNPRNRQASVP